MELSRDFNLALETLKNETGCSVLMESNRMRINYSFYDYEFCEMDMFFKKIVAFCEKVLKESSRIGSKLIIGLLIEVFKEEEKKFSTQL